MANIGQREVSRNYKYEVEIGAIGTFGFSMVSGLSDESEVIEYREGNMAAYPRKLVGQASSGDVTLERGAGDDEATAALLGWRETAKTIMDAGEPGSPLSMEDIREDIIIRVQGEIDQAVILSYKLENAWPSAVEVGDLDAGASEVLIHTLTVVSERTSFAQLDSF